MKFEELSEDMKSQASVALKDAISRRSLLGDAEAKRLGEAVATAFIAMGRHDSAPDVCAD